MSDPFNQRYNSYRGRDGFASVDAGDEQEAEPTVQLPDRWGSAIKTQTKAKPRQRLDPVEEAFGNGAQITIPLHQAIPSKAMTEDQMRAWRAQRMADAGFVMGEGREGAAGANFTPTGGGPSIGTAFNSNAPVRQEPFGSEDVEHYYD